MHAERRIHILEKAFANEAAFGTASALVAPKRL